MKLQASDICGEQAWWQLLRAAPLEAMKSPLFALLTLAEPEKYLAIEEDRVSRWLRDHINLITGHRAEAFLDECCTRAQIKKPDESLIIAVWMCARAESNRRFHASRLVSGEWGRIVSTEQVWQWRRLVQYIEEANHEK